LAKSQKNDIVIVMKWSVETLNADVDKELEALEDSLKAKFLRIAKMLEDFGPEQVKEP